MGQEIVYCSKCAERLLGSDFDKGRAFRVGDMSVCLKCARDLLPTLSPEQRQILTEKFKDLDLRKSSGTYPAAHRPSSSQNPAVSSSSALARTVRSSSSHFPAVKPPGSAEKPGRSSRILVAAVAGGLVLLVGLATLWGGRSSPTVVSREEQPAAPALPATPLPVRPEAPPAPLSVGRPVIPKPVDLKAELAEVDREVAPYVTRQEYGAAWNILSAARPRHLEDPWDLEMRGRLQKLDQEIRKGFTSLLAQAEEARKKENLAGVGELRARVLKWGLASYLAEFDGRLPPLPAAPAPPGPGPGPPAVAPPAALVKAFLLGRVRDFEQAAKEAEDPADQEGIRLASSVPAEAMAILGKWPRGWNLATTLYDPEGTPQKLDEPVVRVEGLRAEVRADRGTRPVEFGEITASSLAELFRGRPAPKENDAKAAAYFCAIEGDPEAARKFWPEVPARVLAASAKAAESANPGREAEARKLFYEAEDLYRAYGTRPAGLPKFQTLLGEYAGTAFVKRNRASIQSRGEGGREYFFAPSDLSGSGAFRLTRHADGRVSWTMEQDAPDKARRTDHYVELEFGALPETEYRLWVFAGACCQETFAFGVQATDLAGAEPGGASASPVVLSIPFLKKTHALHGGRKEPSRWDWIQIPLPPRYAAAGPKTVRLVSDQQGFSVAWAFVSSARRSPPRESEAREMERTRPAPALRTSGPGSVGSILREFWMNVPGRPSRT